MRDKHFVSWFSAGLSHPFTKGMTPMDKVHANALENKHAALEAKIDSEEHRPHPDDTVLAQLKREKLRIKDDLLGH